MLFPSTTLFQAYLLLPRYGTHAVTKHGTPGFPISVLHWTCAHCTDLLHPYRRHLSTSIQSHCRLPWSETRGFDIMVPLFPGPVIQCFDTLPNALCRYEFYYDVVLRGQYTFHIRDLHRQYGPIIRINPYELDISDPAYIDTLYASKASGEKRDKWEWYTKQIWHIWGHVLHQRTRQT